MMIKHKEISRYKYIHSMDCYIYKIECSCGKEVGGWTPQEAEGEYEKHKRGE